MKIWMLALMLLPLAACNRDQKADNAAVQQGVERSVADVRAAQAAAAQPAPELLSAGALADAARSRADALRARADAKAEKAAAARRDTEEEELSEG